MSRRIRYKGQGGPFRSFAPSRIAYVTTGMVRVIIPPAGTEGEIQLQIRMRHTFNTLWSPTHELEKKFRFTVYGVKVSPNIVARRITLQEQTLTVFLRYNKRLWQCLDRGRSLLIESIRKPADGIHVQLLQQESEAP